MTAQPALRAETRAGGPLTPQRLRRLLERLGPTFVKIGQYLALRPDLLSQAHCNELLRLVDQVPQEPFGRASATLTEDLGAPPEELFAWIGRQPVGSGSLAQVYQARTADGAELAVKVQRSDAPARIRRDLARARPSARTEWPRPTRPRTTWRPMNPVAPVTRTVLMAGCPSGPAAPSRACRAGSA